MSGNAHLDLTDADQTLLEFAATTGERFSEDQTDAWEALYRKIHNKGAETALTALHRYRHHFEHDPKALKGFLLVCEDAAAMLCDHEAGEPYTSKGERWAECVKCETTLWRGSR